MNYKLLILFALIASVLLSGCVDKPRAEYKGINQDTKTCYADVNEHGSPYQDYYIGDIRICDNIETTESYNFTLKEMKQKDLTSGKISGSFLLIGGSIYGTIEDKMYLVVTYYDTRISTYKVTKFNLEQIEINTIGKNESAYFKYKVVPDYSSWMVEDRFGTFTARLYLPDGWSII